MSLRYKGQNNQALEESSPTGAYPLRGAGSKSVSLDFAGLGFRFFAAAASSSSSLLAASSIALLNGLGKNKHDISWKQMLAVHKKSNSNALLFKESVRGQGPVLVSPCPCPRLCWNTVAFTGSPRIMSHSPCTNQNLQIQLHDSLRLGSGQA
eukprot:524825-Pelagomonas_calceolata.AAC.6